MTINNIDTAKKPIWSPWETIGLGFAVGLVALVTQIITAGAFVAIRFMPTINSWSEINDNLVNEIGLLTGIATLTSSIIGTGFIFVLVKLRRTISIVDYLAFKRLSKKTLLILPAIVIGYNNRRSYHASLQLKSEFGDIPLTLKQRLPEKSGAL